jgi:rod shape determining protein RodA
LACLYATEYASDDPPRNTMKQLFAAGMALVAALVVLRLGYLRLARYAYALFAIVLVLLVPLVIAKETGFEFGGLVPKQRHAYRWIQLPAFQLQPSELMKYAYILALAYYLRHRRNYRTLGGLVVPVLISAAPILLILREPNLGTALLLVPVLFVMLFVAGAQKRHLALFLACGFVIAPLLWNKIEPYQRTRITGVLLQSDALREAIIAHPEAYAHLCSKRQALEWEAGAGMQLVRSKAALGSGGVLGEGWGQGTYVNYNFLPDRHNDFVFALVGHQWGLAGCLLVLACFAVIVVAAAQIASVTAEPFGRLVAVGILTVLGTQTAVNVCMTLGLMPITGMTLPFVSYGGSSLLANAIGAALLISVSQHRPFMLAKKPFEYATAGPRPEPIEVRTAAEAARG